MGGLMFAHVMQPTLMTTLDNESFPGGLVWSMKCEAAAGRVASFADCCPASDLNKRAVREIRASKPLFFIYILKRRNTGVKVAPLPDFDEC